jgi:transposase
VPDGSGTAKALDTSFKRWKALACYPDAAAVLIDNNWVERQVRSWSLSRSNWLFAGSLKSGQRAAAVITLIQCAKLNWQYSYVYLKDVLTRLPTQINNAISELLPHNWTAEVHFLYLNLDRSREPTFSCEPLRDHSNCGFALKKFVATIVY